MLVHNTKFVEMLDKKDSIVWQEKYPVQAGIADGHIYIDKELNPEDYRIHAYTRFSFLDDTIVLDRRDTCKNGIQGVERERYIWYKSFFAKQLSYYHSWIYMTV